MSKSLTPNQRAVLKAYDGEWQAIEHISTGRVARSQQSLVARGLLKMGPKGSLVLSTSGNELVRTFRR